MMGGCRPTSRRGVRTSRSLTLHPDRPPSLPSCLRGAPPADPLRTRNTYHPPCPNRTLDRTPNGSSQEAAPPRHPRQRPRDVLDRSGSFVFSPASRENPESSQFPSLLHPSANHCHVPLTAVPRPPPSHHQVYSQHSSHGVPHSTGCTFTFHFICASYTAGMSLPNSPPVAAPSGTTFHSLRSWDTPAHAPRTSAQGSLQEPGSFHQPLGPPPAQGRTGSTPNHFLSGTPPPHSPPCLQV